MGAAVAQRVDQHVAPLARAGDQDALERDVRQRLDQALGHRARGDGVGRDPVLAEGPRGAGPHRRDVEAGEAARVAAGVEQAREQLVDAVRARRHEAVVAAEVGEVGGRARRSGSPAPRSPLAPSSRSRAASGLAWARARVTATVRPCSGRRSSHARSSRSAATGPTTVTAGARMRSASARAATSASVATTVRWPGSVPRSITATGSPGGASLRLQPLGDPRERAHAHVEDERAGEARERGPVERGAGLVRVLVPGDEGHAAGELAMRDRDPGVGRRRDPGGDPRHDLERRRPPRAARAPPRRRGRTRTGRRP